MVKGGAAVEIEGVRITHPEKVVWPDAGITKLELAQYYARMAPVMLRYVKDRPVTLRPFPQGVDRPGFYLKDKPRGAPSWIQTFEDRAGSTREIVHFVVASEARMLVWAAQINSVEVHPWLSTVEHPDTPDWAVVDLDPFEGTAWERISRAALLVREGLARLGLQSFPKLTGQTGVHVLVPIEPSVSFDHVRSVFERLARELAEAHPDLLTTGYQVEGRRGRILIDYAQNARAKTTVAPYSPRPKPGAPVAAPVTWEEMEDPGLALDAWNVRTILDRLERVGDVLEPALGLRQRLPSL